MPLVLRTQFDLPRCPHCGVDAPNLICLHHIDLKDYAGEKKLWVIYGCARCTGVVSAVAERFDRQADAWFPRGRYISEDIPDRPRQYLQQALDSISTPAGAVMLSASAVDAMLKAKELVEGTLYKRIDKAKEMHLITPGMAQWAHDVRLDANDERHADTHASLPTRADAERCVDFALALAELLFVLPARVQRGISAAEGQA
jgi:hypothetical protein